MGSLLLQRALRLAAWPVLLALLITPVRFGLELAGVPTVLVFPLGLLWLALGFTVFLGFRLSNEEHRYPLLLLSLVVFSPPSRFPVFVLWWITKTWGPGTHYDVFDSRDQALIGQLFHGSLIQVTPGFLIGSPILAIRRSRAGSS